MTFPAGDIEHVRDAHRRFIGRVESLDDEVLRQPSLLPGWTVAHVLAHVAGNADSHVRRTQAAIKGLMVDQYPGGMDGRAAEIEAAAQQPAPQLIADVRRSAQAVDEAWRAPLGEAWTRITRDVGGRERALSELPARRWQEVEVHLVDLGIGVSYRDWPDDFVAAWLPRVRAHMADRVAAGFDLPHFDDGRDELAWLYGRLHRDDLPSLPPWG